MPPIGSDIPVSERSMLASHRFQDAHPDSYPIVKHSFLFAKANVELQAGLRPENKRLFQLPMRLVACTMQEQHPTDPIQSPLQPRTPLASHIRKSRRRRPVRQSLSSVLALSPGSPESPTRSGGASGLLSTGVGSPLKTPVRDGTSPTAGSPFRKRGGEQDANEGVQSVLPLQLEAFEPEEVKRSVRLNKRALVAVIVRAFSENLLNGTRSGGRRGHVSRKLAWRINQRCSWRTACARSAKSFRYSLCRWPRSQHPDGRLLLLAKDGSNTHSAFLFRRLLTFDTETCLLDIRYRNLSCRIFSLSKPVALWEQVA